MSSFFKFFAERHTLANLIIIMMIALGLNTFMNIRRDLFPKVDYGVMMIKTLYPGASPEDVELNVTNKIEDEVRNVAGIDWTTSTSMENVSVIFVYIDTDAEDQDKVKTDIREAVGRVTDLPAEVTESPEVFEISTTSDIPVIEIGVSGDIPYRELREYIREFEKKLRDIDGVSRLEKFGYQAREIKVEVSSQAVKNFQIPLREIIMAIQARNIRTTAGNFESYTSEKNLVTLAQFEDPYEVGNVVIRSTFEGPLIKVKDLAIVKDDFEDARVMSRMNGQPAISFAVYKNESADIIRTCDAVKKLAARVQENLPEGVEILYSTDISKQVRNRFNVVISNLLIGLVLVLALLTAFLNIRTSFWVALGIPVSFLGVIFMLPFFGQSISSPVLVAMILVLGLIVDDAIIISENIYHHSERGEAPLKAAVEGTREVFAPVLTTVLTTFLAFAPMFFMTGVFGKFIFVIPLTISLALFISLGEALVSLPAHLLHGLRHHPAKSTTHSWFNFLRDRYRRLVPRILRLRYLFVLLFVIMLFGSLWFGATNMKFILFPSNMASEFYVLAELPIGSSLEATSDNVKRIEELIIALPEDELESFVTRIGQNPWLEAESENYAALAVSLTPFTERERTADEIVEALRQQTDQFLGFENISYMIVTGGPPVGRPISIQIVGSHDDYRKQVADSLVAFLGTISGVKDVQRDDKPGKEQVEIKINYDKLSRLGLTVADIAQNVRIAYDGEVVTSARYGDEDVDFRVLFEEKIRRQLNYIKELPIPNRLGRLIPLKSVATLKTGPGPSDYRHYKGDRTITVEADVDQSIITALEATNKVFEHFDLDRQWPGTRFVLAGEVMETEESMANLMKTFIIAVVAIYFLLVLLFNSFTQPFSVLVAIPFGIIGVIIAFVLHGEPMSFVGMLGVVGLAGVVVNDSLVLVNHINQLRRERPGDQIIHIAAEATSNRLRPVVLTTLTTVAGLLPLAYGLGGTDPFMAPTALALGYGLLFATPLTLVLIPCLYMVQYDVRMIFRRGFGQAFKREEILRKGRKSSKN
ncbi:MAG: efflux RND transporter permease subunit [candidate division WOR-3 bacterium]|nr:MAG: efflux RND transporter permease subunit [candidate division WOR-3 bacterium]